MRFGRSYQVSEAIIQELKEAGVRGPVLSALRGTLSASPYGMQDFTAMLAKLGAAPTPEEAALIRKYCQTSLLRLEKLLPNRRVREWVDALVFAVVIALLVRTFLFAPFKIPSGSMIPTIEVGDHIFATMYNYGIPVPFTDIKLFPRPVQRGDIIIFPYPKDPSVDYIKRVVARGGDTLAVEGRTVLVNGKPLVEPYAYYDPSREGAFGIRCEGLAFCGPLTVPEGDLFVMGDNRLDSADSRVWGFVPESSVRGEGRIVYWSHDPNAGWLDGIRFNRLGKLLH